MDQPKIASYRPVKDDGALFCCNECFERSHASQMWFITTPDGKSNGVYHKDCVDAGWLETATFNPEGI